MMTSEELMMSRMTRDDIRMTYDDIGRTHDVRNDM